jgi:hypothetical protein
LEGKVKAKSRERLVYYNATEKDNAQKRKISLAFTQNIAALFVKIKIAGSQTQAGKIPHQIINITNLQSQRLPYYIRNYLKSQEII